MILNRIKPILDSLQDPEQAGFRPDYSCNEAMQSLRMVAEKADEWGEHVWAVSLDLEKAFDKVLHSSVFKSLAEARVESDIVNVLWNLYALQTACVCLDGGVQSRAFKILCGV